MPNPTDDLTRFLDYLRAVEAASPRTVDAYRRDLLALARSISEDDPVDWPALVDKIFENDKVVCWW